jgi:hypothetical protein
MSLAPAIPRRFRSGQKPLFSDLIHPSSFLIHPLTAPLSPQTPSHRVSAPRPGTTRPSPLKSNFLADTHCAPWPEVVRASFNDQGFRESALIFCGGLTPADFQTAFKRLEEQSRELEAAQVDAMGEIGGKKPHPATIPAS